MAILRSLLLRHRATAASLLRCLPISVASIPASSSVVSPQKPPTPSPPWKTIPVRRFGSASPAAESPKAEDLRPCDPDIDEIEGCDFNHWLIVVDFPKDPRPSPEEMVRFYEETCAKALNLSLDEAKKKIYATSTSNYTGFHVQVTEKESEKFQGQPGVVFVLPDSYADKENKEYGGDKYINGIIIPRPRNTKGKRTWDERNQDQRRWNQHEQQTQDGPVQQQRVYPPYTHQGLTQATVNNNGPPPSHPPPTQQSYGPTVGHGTDPRYHPFQQNYYGERRPQPNYPFQQPFGPPIMFPRRNPYQQGNVSWVPHQSNYIQVPPLPQVVVLLLLPNGTLSQVASFDGYQGQGIPWVYSPGPSFGAFGPGYPGPIQFPGFSQVDQRNHAPLDWYRASYEQGPTRWSQANLQGQPYSAAVGQGYPGPAQGLGFSQVDQRNYVPPDWYHSAYEQGLRWSQANMQGQPHSPAVGQGYTAPPFQGQAYPGHPNQSKGQGQGYLGHPSHGQGQAYPGHPGQDQGQAYSGYPSQVQGQAYSGQPIQGQGQAYSGQPIQGQGQAHPGQPNQGQGFTGQPSQDQGQGYPVQPIQGQGYPGQPNQGLGYPGQPNQGQGYAPPREHRNNGQHGTPTGQQTDNGHHGQGPPMGHLRGPNS